MEWKLLSKPSRSHQDEVLDKVSQEGGFAFVAQIMMAGNGNVQAAEAAHDMAWEQLHSAPWHSVEPAWRDAYSLSCLHIASFRYYAGKMDDALRALDMGLIMGGSLLRLHLNSAISVIQAAKPSAHLDASDNPQHSRIQPISFNTDSSTIDRGVSLPYEILKTLPRQSFSSETVEKQRLLPLEDFLCNYFLPTRPVIITGAISHWPAMKKWKDIEYLKQAIGHRTVPVEVGQNYLSPGWKQELITVSELIQRIHSKDESCGITYLAQHPLFDQISQLYEDISIPDYCTVSGGELHSINAWFGPTGTVTPLHHDPHHNLLAQVVGKKYIRLYSPPSSEILSPYSDTMLKNSSQVDLDNVDLARNPAIKNLCFLDCVLNEGEMLYIPPTWWHYVRSLSTSFSVSFWWSVES